MCPHCRASGFLILHGYLYGYEDSMDSKRIRRGHRIFCSDRRRRAGCGRTFSLLQASFMTNFMISTKTLWEFLQSMADGLNRFQAFIPVREKLEISSIYRLFNCFKHNQSRIRTALVTAQGPPDVRDSDPVMQTIGHLKSLFKDDSCPVASFQHRFQISFL